MLLPVPIPLLLQLLNFLFFFDINFVVTFLLLLA